ncbi:MAG: hypothetical protein GY756_02380 [bacterium]|nr:hypothetical protein [bacterium]
MNRQNCISEKYPFIVLCIITLISISYLFSDFSYLTTKLTESLFFVGLILLIYFTYKTKRLVSMWYFIMILVIYNPFTDWNNPIVDNNSFVVGLWYCIDILVLIIFLIYSYIYFPRKQQ